MLQISTRTHMGEVIEFPADKSLEIVGRERFPGLHLEYAPSIFTPRTACAETFWPLFCRLTYTTRKWPSAPENGDVAWEPYYAWFADRGEWLFSFGEKHNNAFIPQAWPTFLAGMRYHALQNIASYVGRGASAAMEWNACLVACLQPGVTHFVDPSERDGWEGAGELVHEVHCIVGPVDGKVTFTADLSPQGTSVLMTLASGACVVLRTSECIRKWKFAFKNTSATGTCFVVSLRALNPVVALNNVPGRMWEQNRMRAAIDNEERVIPAIHFSSGAKKQKK